MIYIVELFLVHFRQKSISLISITMLKWTNRSSSKKVQKIVSIYKIIALNILW